MLCQRTSSAESCCHRVHLGLDAKNTPNTTWTGNTQHLSSQAGVGSDQLTLAELSHTCTEGSSLGSEPHPGISVLRGEAAFSW